MRVEIWSDMVCPWCFIGKRRFAAALSRFEHREAVAVEWRSFELDPQAARGSDESLEVLLARKYGVSLDRARAMNARVTALAAQAGLEFRLDRAHPANTFDAHRLAHFAGTQGRRAQMTERLFRAYFQEGEDLGDREVLLRLAREMDLDAEAAHTALGGETFADAVRDEERRAAEFGIQGVPYFALDEHFGISGAQPADQFLAVLREAWKHSSHPESALESELKSKLEEK